MTEPSDLVDRLRVHQTFAEALAERTGVRPLLDEAANYIESLEADRDALVELLEGLSKRHEGWQHGCGPCVCKWHERTRTTLARIQEKTG